jgi:hypothetical protein
MKAHFTLPEYDGARFLWSGNNGFVDASDLGIPAGKQPGERVWNDSCDVGFMVRGRQSTLAFLLYHTDRHEDGSFRSWMFRSEGHQFFITIYND